MSSGFPIRFPLGMMAGALVGLALGAGAAYWKVHSWTDDQRFYWKTYYHARLDELAEKAGRPHGERAYLVKVGNQYGVMRMRPGVFALYLQQKVYGGKAWIETSKEPALWLLGCVLVCAVGGKGFDLQRRKNARWGQHIRGTRSVSCRQNNKEALAWGEAPGITIPVGRWPWQKIIIPLSLEAYHFGISGRTGSGKSTLIRWILKQVAERGESAIIYDPKQELRDEFYSESRGDIILDPTDARCPYWALENETRDEATATPWGKAWFPDEPRDQPYFKKHPREIISFLLDRCSSFNQPNPEEQATCKNLARWVANPSVELTKRLKGTTYAVDINPAAKNQSQGLLSTLGEIAKPLRMMPDREDGRQVFSVSEYSDKRRGWIFMTSTPDTVEALLPMQSAIMDMLILKTQAWRRGARKVWFIYEELPTMQRQQQLESGMTKQRASGNPIVIGYHDSFQVKERYGENGANTILSQPSSNFFLGTGHGATAKAMELQIGHEEVERVSENRPVRLREAHARGPSLSSQTAERAVVMAAEVQGRKRFQGYFLQEGRKVDIVVQKLERVIRTRRIERLIPPMMLHDTPEPPTDRPVPANDVPPNWPDGMPVEPRTRKKPSGSLHTDRSENAVLAAFRRDKEKKPPASQGSMFDTTLYPE